jgi:hypothetical protein
VKGGRYRHGPLLLVEDLLLVQTEDARSCFWSRALRERVSSGDSPPSTARPGTHQRLRACSSSCAMTAKPRSTSCPPATDLAACRPPREPNANWILGSGRPPFVCRRGRKPCFRGEWVQSRDLGFRPFSDPGALEKLEASCPAVLSFRLTDYSRTWLRPTAVLLM